jgi:hypothetical protein
MDAYEQGDFTSIPNGTVLAGAPITRTPPPLHVPGTPTPHDQQIHVPAHSSDDTASAPPTDGGTSPGTSSGGSTPPPGGGGGTGGGGGGGGGGVHHGGVTLPPLPTSGLPPVDQALTLAQATAQCILDGLNQTLQPAAFQACLDHYMHP